MTEIILCIAFFSSAQGAFSSQLELFMHPNMIFGRYGEWIRAKEDSGAWWAKPLGGCVYCMNIWLACATYWLAWYLLPLTISQTFIFYIAYIFLSGGFCRIFKVA